MADAAPSLALGLMSGTSMDGIDGAVVRTDGRRQVAPVAALTVPYDAAFCDRLRGMLGQRRAPDGIVRQLTDRHAEVVARLIDVAGLAAADIAVIGFHGQTIHHDPAHRLTVQIGDGARLAAATGIDVVADFRSADVAGGGEGAPLAPVFHAALAGDLARPLCVLNLGGVANVSWIGAGDGALVAFDCGPGGALIDDWVRRTAGQAFDRDGALAAAGAVDEAVVARLMDDAYFARRPPKSLDRDAFTAAAVAGLDAAAGAATLTAFTAAAVAAAVDHLPAPPRRWLVSGGGRHNPVLLAMLARRLAAPVEPVEAVGWDGDALEAQAFAYLAVRSLAGLPLSFPGTTGVARPVRGGVLHRAAEGPR